MTKDELFSLEDSLPQASFIAAANSRYVSVKQVGIESSIAAANSRYVSVKQVGIESSIAAANSRYVSVKQVEIYLKRD